MRSPARNNRLRLRFNVALKKTWFIVTGITKWNPVTSNSLRSIVNRRVRRRKLILICFFPIKAVQSKSVAPGRLVLTK